MTGKEMIVRLNNEQISEYWNDIKEAVMASAPRLPKEVDAWLNVILQKILFHEGQVWVGLEDNTIKVMCVTFIIKDVCSLHKQLLLYALYGYDYVGEELWNEGLRTFKHFASSEGCNAIVAYTEVSRITEVAKNLGFSTNIRYVTLEV